MTLMDRYCQWNSLREEKKCELHIFGLFYLKEIIGINQMFWKRSVPWSSSTPLKTKNQTQDRFQLPAHPRTRSMSNLSQCCDLLRPSSELSPYTEPCPRPDWVVYIWIAGIVDWRVISCFLHLIHDFICVTVTTVFKVILLCMNIT